MASSFMLEGRNIVPPDDIETPCLVVDEANVISNLHATAKAAGGVERLVPHIKTHRAPWIIRLMMEHGVKRFKCSTPAEAEMLIEARANVIEWAFPTPNRAGIRRLLRAASAVPDIQLIGMVDSFPVLDAWLAELNDSHHNVGLRVDLDLGLGRTGVGLDAPEAIDLSLAVNSVGRLVGWHAYDGHVRGTFASRQARVEAEARKLRAFRQKLQKDSVTGDVLAGGSHSFNLWPKVDAEYVSPGSFVYSSSQHEQDLPELEWKRAAFVATTVISVHEGTMTLDAGGKAISPDRPMAERFIWPSEILMVNEEHSVVKSTGASVGDIVFLFPNHACTTAYLYEKAYVLDKDGNWSIRSQLGGRR